MARIRCRIAVALVLAVALALPASSQAVFPGANGKIAFESMAPDVRHADLFAIDPDGTDRIRLTSATGFYPRWSPDGTMIALTIYSSPDNFNLFPNVYVMNADGTGITRLVENAVGATWSPDGEKLAYVGVEHRNLDVFTIHVDGTGKTRLTNQNGLREQYLDWSPDGTRIAFDNGLQDIWTIRSDGSLPTPLTTNDGTIFDYAPRWSPDGTKIAFTSDRDADFPNCSGSCNQEIYVMNSEGSGQTRITFDPARDQFPAWSPDGTKIAFERGLGSPTDLFTMNADGSAITNVTNSAVFEARPDWQPIPGPRRSDYKNAAQFCKAERVFLGDAPFTSKYGGGANAYGKCVSQNH